MVAGSIRNPRYERSARRPSRLYRVVMNRDFLDSQELRQLTLEEINEFLNGNAALATGSSKEVNVDCIGFPECFQIPPMDLKMRMLSIVTEYAC